MFLRDVSPLLKQTWIMSSVLLFNVSCGMMVDQTILVPALLQPGSSISRESTACLFILGLGCSGIQMHWCGRRTAFLGAAVSAAVSWLTRYFADSTTLLAIGRHLGDFSNGAGVILGAIIIGEYTNPIYRGAFLSLASSSLAFGRMAAYCIGNWGALSLLALVPSMLSAAIAYTWPESPAWLASSQRYEECKTSFVWLRGSSFTDIKELTRLIETQKNAATKISRSSGLFEFLGNAFKNYKIKKIMQPIVIIIFTSILLEASGIEILKAHGPELFAEIFGKLPSFYLTLCVNITSSILFTSLLASVLKRRTLLFFTGPVNVIVLVVISILLFLISNDLSGPIKPWLCVTIFVIYLVLLNVYFTMFLIWSGEVFPLEYKSFGLFISGSVLILNKNICLKITSCVVSALGLYVACGLSAVTLTVVLLNFYFIAPETKDKSLMEIEYNIKDGIFEEERDDDVVFNML